MSEFKAHGFRCVCNSWGYEIEINESGDGVRWRISDADCPPSEAHEAAILYTDEEEARAYFLIGKEDAEDNREYLENYMRC